MKAPKIKTTFFLSIFLYYVLPDDGPFRPIRVASTSLSTILVVIDGVLI